MAAASPPRGCPGSAGLQCEAAFFSAAVWPGLQGCHLHTGLVVSQAFLGVALRSRVLERGDLLIEKDLKSG